MEKITRKPIEGARVLTPLEMNKIHFATGRHTEVAGKGIDIVKPLPGIRVTMK